MPVNNNIDPWLAQLDGPVPRVRAGCQVRVSRYDPAPAAPPPPPGTGEGGDPEPAPPILPPAGPQYVALPNLEPVSVVEQLGVEAPTARLRYRFDEFRGHPDAPQDATEALSTAVAKPLAVKVDDRIVIEARMPGGAWRPLFDGHALSFELSLQGNEEIVSVLCVGRAALMSRYPLAECVWRGTGAPFDPGPDNHGRIAEIARFNPRGEPNCILAEKPGGGTNWIDGESEDEDVRAYPAFIDPARDAAGAPASKRWSLAESTIYLIAVGEVAARNHFLPDPVRFPQNDDLLETLTAKVPAGDGPVDPTDPSSYVRAPITTPDYPIAWKPFPAAILDVVGPAGFAMAWRLDAAEGGYTRNELVIFHPQERSAKDVFLQPRGATLDPALSNISAAHVARDVSEAVGAWAVEGNLIEHELSLILYPGFETKAAHSATIPALQKYRRNHPDFLKNADAYRLFIFAEDGARFSIPGVNDNFPPNTPDDILKDAFNVPELVDPDGPFTFPFVRRRRGPMPTLISTNEGTPLRPRLSISTDYDPDVDRPHIWTREAGGTWQPVEQSWELLKDRIGIRVTGMDPNDWDIGASQTAGMPYLQGKVRVVRALSSPNLPPFYLRLTCVIREDRRCRHRTGSPFADPGDKLVRSTDATDRYRTQVVGAGSELNPGTAQEPAETLLPRDDRPLAEHEAVAMLAATGAGVMGGVVELPYITRHYEPGDRIRGINGRSLAFRADAGDAQADPIYPVVVGRQFLFGGTQKTVLQLSDANMARHSYATRIRAGVRNDPTGRPKSRTGLSGRRPL